MPRTAAAPPARLHARASGLVQGVNFRQSAARRALALRLTGWVRNLPDGAVEAVAEGRREDLQAFLDYLHRGPPAARVAGVDAEWLAATGEFVHFTILT
jgi:acylphosphatase